MDGLDPTIVSYGELDELLPELEQLTWDMEEPFNGNMTLIRAVYMAARRKGLTMLLDGVGGDTVLSEDRRLARLLRAGRWRTAYREATMLNLFWKGAYGPYRNSCGARARHSSLTVFSGRFDRLRQQRRRKQELPRLADRRAVRPADGRRRAP